MHTPYYQSCATYFFVLSSNPTIEAYVLANKSWGGEGEVPPVQLSVCNSCKMIAITTGKDVAVTTGKEEDNAILSSLSIANSVSATSLPPYPSMLLSSLTPTSLRTAPGGRPHLDQKDPPCTTVSVAQVKHCLSMMPFKTYVGCLVMTNNNHFNRMHFSRNAVMRMLKK